MSKYYCYFMPVIVFIALFLFPVGCDFCHATQEQQAVLVAPEQNVAQKTIVEKNYRFILACFILVEVFLLERLEQPELHDSSLCEQFKLQNVVKTLCTQYFASYAASFFHELGHALAAKICNGDPINMHIGANSTDGATALITVGGVSLDGFSPGAGYTVYSEPSENNKQIELLIFGLAATSYCKRKNIDISQFTVADFTTKEFKDLCAEVAQTQSVRNSIQVNTGKQIAILLAGGLSGLFGNFLLKFLINLAWGIKDGSLSLADVFAGALCQAFKLDSVSVNQLSNLLLPFGQAASKSDAFQLYNKYVGIDAQKLAYAEYPALAVRLLMEYYLVNIQDQQHVHSASFPKKLGLTFANYLLKGYFFVHA